MLDSLGEYVVRALSNRDAVDEVERSALALDRVAEVLAKQLAAAEEAHDDAVGLLGE